LTVALDTARSVEIGFSPSPRHKAVAIYMASRPFLECHVRRRLQTIENVTILGGQDVAELTRRTSWYAATPSAASTPSTGKECR
jgi:hypothetical protein